MESLSKKCIDHRVLGHTQRGFTYLALLFVVAIMGAGLASTGVIWSTEVRRSKEKELRFVGQQFRHAIGNYYESSPGNQKKYPPRLGELLQDNRYPFVRRHLRQVYHDPFTGRAEWGVVRSPDGGVMGVYSLAPLTVSSVVGERFTYLPKIFATGLPPAQ